MYKTISLFLFAAFNLFSKDNFKIDDIKIKCNCDKDKEWKIKKIDPNWTEKLKIHPPNISFKNKKHFR